MDRQHSQADGFAFMKRKELLSLLGSTLSLTLVLGLVSAPLSAAERPTLNKRTCDPRPDIIPHTWYHSLPEYRRTYNRPRYLSGWVAYKIAPTSQEAMVWTENVRAGAYDTKHAPPRYKRYFGPKPWEVLQTGSRPDYPKPPKLQALPYNPKGPQEDVPPVPVEPAPAALESDPSPSDLPSALKPAEQVPAPVKSTGA